MKRDALGGLFAVFARAAAATARKVYERLSYLSLSLFLSLVYQPLRFRNYFYVPSSKAGPRHHAPPARPKDYRPIDYGSVRTLPIERKFEKGDESITKEIFIRAFSKDNKIMETFENCSKYRDLVKERKGKSGEEGLPWIEGSSLYTYIYIYIYLCSGYHAAGGMLIYTKRQDLCGRTARLSRNTAPELSRVGRNDTAKKG